SRRGLGDEGQTRQSEMHPILTWVRGLKLGFFEVPKSETSQKTAIGELPAFDRLESIGSAY
ncbi:MAG: hypothetical protein ACO4AI_09310, partial [Prochlorothrix sp.]